MWKERCMNTGWLRYGLSIALLILITHSFLLSVDGASSRKKYTFEGKIYEGDALNACEVHIVGASGRHSALITKNGQFQIYQVAAGAYMLEIFSQHFVYPTYSIKVGPKMSVVEMNNNTRVSYPLQAQPIARAMWFEPRVGFNPLSYLRNPMVLMVIVGGGLMMVPKLLKYLDPDTMKQVEEQRKKGGLTALLKQASQPASQAKGSSKGPKRRR